MDDAFLKTPYSYIRKNFQDLSVQYPPVGRDRAASVPDLSTQNISSGLSHRISQLIADNESIIGPGSISNPPPRPSDRKRVNRGPWRYDERIQQLGYQPNISTTKKPQVRRNSLPVQPQCYNRGQLRPYPTLDFPQGVIRRRSSLPVPPPLSMSEGIADASWRIAMNTSPSFQQHQASRPSVICENPIYRPNRPELPNDRNQVDHKDHQPMTIDGSDEDELIVVDSEDSQSGSLLPYHRMKSRVSPMEVNTHSVIQRLPHADSIIRAPSFSDDDLPLDAAIRRKMEENSIDSAPKSSKASHKSGKLTSEVFNVLDEVMLRASATAKNSGGDSPRQTTGTVKFVADGSTPNAVLFNPINDPIRTSTSSNPDAANSDDEDTRPYKCVHCNKGFRISGHLARHMKSETHLRRLQELAEIQGAPVFDQQRQIPVFDQVQDRIPSNPIQVPVPIPVPPQGFPTSVFQASVLMKNQIQAYTQSITRQAMMSCEDSADEDEDENAQQRKFRCDICDIGFRFQGHLDRHKRSTAHLSMIEAANDHDPNSPNPADLYHQVQLALEANSQAQQWKFQSNMVRYSPIDPP